MMYQCLKCSGFSQIELLTVLALLVLIPALATPAISGIVNSTRVHSGAEAIFNSLLLARSEAARRNDKVVVCKSANGVVCASSGDWNQGWIVFHDQNNNGSVDAGEAIVYREPALSERIRLLGNGPVSNYVSYGPHGKTTLVSGAFQAGTITACVVSKGKTDARQVVINSSGRPRQARTTVDACA
jgi:type IV fimbrial biogenesis protein FimT